MRHNSLVNPYPRTWVEIDLPALKHNLGLVREALGNPETRVALVAKADAYGHGLVPVSRFALQNGADWVAVATVQEGIALRDAGVEAPIVVISPILPIEADQAVFYRLRIVVERSVTAQALSVAATEQDVEAYVHLEVDTGLARFGCMPQDATAIACEIGRLPRTRLEGICTHFANSGRDPERTNQQLELFHQAIRACRAQGIEFEMVHAGNSAGAALYPETRHDMVRVGISAYGMDPYDMFGGRAIPVLTWKARVMAMRELPPGSPVSYSGTYLTKRKERIATLGVGYGDGYPRALSNRGVVQIKGREAPVVGMVCMDQVLIDVTDIPSVDLGDEAVLVGENVPAERLAKIIDTTAHALTTQIMSRVPRRYRHT